MRSLVKFTAFFFIIVAATAVNAQAQKFGHIDLQALVQLMPERAKAETEFNKFQSDLEDIFSEMQKNYQAKLGELEQLGDSVSQIKKNAKIAELQDIQQRVQNYQQSASTQLQQKQNEVLKPVFEKAEKAIEAVGKEKGLVYVFDIGTKVVLYKSTESIDLLPFVKVKLGI